jgi:hypothetical protein
MIRRNYFLFAKQYDSNGRELVSYYRQFSIKSLFSKNPVKIAESIMEKIADKENCEIERIQLCAFNRI